MQRAPIKQAYPQHIDTTWRVGIVYSSYYPDEIASLVAGARHTLMDAGISEENVTLHAVSGSYEIPLIGASLAESKRVDALIGIGIIVQGATEHAGLVADTAAKGMMDVQTIYRIPFACQVLHVHTVQDAIERSTGDNNKGIEAAHAVLHSLAQLHTL